MHAALIPALDSPPIGRDDVADVRAGDGQLLVAPTAAAINMV